jgi:multicomponent Na+:H+ antiporter subunit E
VHSVLLGAVLLALWLLLSGHREPLLLWSGAGSCALVAFVAARMDRVDGEPQRLTLRPLRTLAYLGWLAVEIVKANVAVSRIILDRRLPISPTLIRMRCTQRTLLGHVVYANSITLTPGTVSINLRLDTIAVHALTHAGALELEAGEMDRRVTSLERGPDRASG